MYKLYTYFYYTPDFILIKIINVLFLWMKIIVFRNNILNKNF